MALIEQLYKPDLAFLPIGDFYTMGPREAALACRLLNVKKVVPMHFGTFPALIGTPAELTRELKDFPRTEVWPLEIGKPARW
jgi:L-ascorbate metabolism protein UlaG (beta-lactamase superfamily)